MNEEDEVEWIELEKSRLGDKILEYKTNGEDVPEKLKNYDIESKIKELKTWWKRADWGTQSEIVQESQVADGSGLTTDWTAYRMSQMKKLMTRWNLKTSNGEPIPINEIILRKLDYNVAIALLNRYEDKVGGNDELEDFE
jgi:hypothetical protein